MGHGGLGLGLGLGFWNEYLQIGRKEVNSKANHQLYPRPDIWKLIIWVRDLIR